MNSRTNFEQLYQIIGFRSTDVTYPYCQNCYKKVFYLNHKKKWNCTSCKEDFEQVNHRYKLNLEITNYNDFKCVTVFGKQLELLFGVEPNKLYRYKNKILNLNQNWSSYLENAFKYCLIGRWLFFDINESKDKFSQQNSLIVNNVRLPKTELDYFVPIYNYLSNRSNISEKLIHNETFLEEKLDESIINETIYEANDDEKCSDELSSLIENITIKDSNNQQKGLLANLLN